MDRRGGEGRLGAVPRRPSTKSAVLRVPPPHLNCETGGAMCSGALSSRGRECQGEEMSNRVKVTEEAEVKSR